MGGGEVRLIKPRGGGGGGGLYNWLDVLVGGASAVDGPMMIDCYGVHSYAG